MPVTPFEVGDLFVYRVIKHHTANPDRQWSNTYEFQATVAGDEGTHLSLVDVLLLFESQMALNTTRFDRITVSTWVPDSKPYDPVAFISTPVSGGGLVLPATDAVALNVVESVARAALTGRFGHIFYRNWLVEGDMTAPAGKYVLTDRPAKQATLEGALEDSGLVDYIGTGSSAGLRMVLVGKTDADVRPVVGLSVQGVSVVPFDHAWFNRTTGP